MNELYFLRPKLGLRNEKPQLLQIPYALITIYYCDDSFFRWLVMTETKEIKQVHDRPVPYRTRTVLDRFSPS